MLVQLVQDSAALTANVAKQGSAEPLKYTVSENRARGSAFPATPTGDVLELVMSK